MKNNRRKIDNSLTENEMYIRQIGRNIAHIMAELDIGQREMSILLGVNQGRVSEILRGVKPQLSWFTLFKIAEALSVTMDELVHGTYSIKKIKQNLKAKLVELRNKN